MTTQIAPSGWYAIIPEGGGTVLVEFDSGGRMTALVEESMFSTHLAANDSRANAVRAYQDGQTDVDVSQSDARAVIAAWDADVDADSACVERIIGID